MNYYEMLADMVKNSNLTLKEIADKCEKEGVKITPAYISRLQTGKQAPASDEVNSVLAKVCGVDKDLFVYLGHMEKAPEKMRDFVNRMLEFFRYSMVVGAPDQLKPILEEKLSQMSDLALVNSFLDTKMPKPNGSSFTTKVENNDELKYKVTRFPFNMEDASMEPRIPKGSNIELTQFEDINLGDIIVAKLKDGSHIIRRYIPLEDNIVLLSDNLSFEAITLVKESVEIIGKVKSINIEIN